MTFGPERERRQTIGRGLRLCVNQEGERQHGFDVNTLTVVAVESYEEFAENLQQEIETETGIRFGVVGAHEFAAIPVRSEDGQTTALGGDASKVLWEYLKSEGYIAATGRIQDSLRRALKDETFIVPETFTEQLAGDRQGAAQDRRAPRDQERRQAPHGTPTAKPCSTARTSKKLWDRIKHKTTYRVEFDNEKLLIQCIRALQAVRAIPKTRLQWRKADIAIGAAGVEATETIGAATMVLDESDIELPDVLTVLQDRTQLTRRSIQSILCESARLDDFKHNPQQFIELAEQAINRCKQHALVDGIKYQRLGEDCYYAQELFEQEELTGYLNNMFKVKKSVYEQVVYESGTESRFADQLEKNTAVKVYAKLPGWFTVPTPLGSYKPGLGYLDRLRRG